MLPVRFAEWCYMLRRQLWIVESSTHLAIHARMKRGHRVASPRRIVDLDCENPCLTENRVLCCGASGCGTLVGELEIGLRMPMQTGGSGTSRRARRNDPGRRDRIIDTCLDVIAEVGVAGASYRRIAEAADVPLGSMTYHFSGVDNLLHEAFTRFAGSVAERFEHRMEQARNVDSACDAVVSFILEDVFGDQRDLVLTHELYTLSARNPSFREITTSWMGRSRVALERHFDSRTARILDALIEGLTIHRALDSGQRDPAEVEFAIRRMVEEGT